MIKSPKLAQFFQQLEKSITSGSFIKITLSKARTQSGPKNIFAQPILIKNTPKVNCILRFPDKDETKNYDLESGVKVLEDWITNGFQNADLLTTENNFHLKTSKKGTITLLQRPPTQTSPSKTNHNHQKKEWIHPQNNIYLRELGLVGTNGSILKSGYRKFRQINKYIEIIDSLIKSQKLSNQPRILDMGSGKGYLTFALYDYLSNGLNLMPKITGIELRQPLVDYCNSLAQKASFKDLDFVASDIFDFPVQKLDCLIALHACDIATDIAIAKGIKAQAKLIVVAPCCHKQIRKQLKPSALMQPLVKHGIHQEKIATLITDTIRSLLLESKGYRTKVFEFISMEHTSKNVMITGVKGKARPEALAEVESIKQQFGIEEHYLERLLD